MQIESVRALQLMGRYLTILDAVLAPFSLGGPH